MSGNLDRLRKGERWWAAEVVLRVGGLLLLDACYRAALLAHGLINTPPHHQATPGEFALCAATFLLLTCGLALSFEGRGLFKHIPMPPRPFL